MRKLKLEMQVSLDGFTADRNGDTSWMIWSWNDVWAWDDALRQHHIDLTTSSDCILLSRKMAVEGFHAHWARFAQDTSSPQHAFAKPIADMRKLVFSKTLGDCPWPNTELVSGDLAESIAELKGHPGKDIVVYGGPSFASSLLEAGLIDEINLLVNPTLLGDGRRMAADLRQTKMLTLKHARAFECGVALLTYRTG